TRRCRSTPAWAIRRKCRSSAISATPRSPKSTRAPARSSGWSLPGMRRGCAEAWTCPTRCSPPVTPDPDPRRPCILARASLHPDPHIAMSTPKSKVSKSKVSRPKTAKSAAGAGSRRPRRGGEGVSIEPIIEALRKRVPKTRQPQAEAFARAFYQRMSADEVPQHSAEGWAELAWDFLELARKRKPGTVEMRVFNTSLENDGWESPHTVVQIVNDDMPFLVDSVTMALADQGIGVHVLGHPVVRVRRNKAGELVAVGDEAGEESRGESLMHLEIDRQTTAEMPAIERTLQSVLLDVRAAVSDWEAMRQKMLEVA